jgi:hypothetical protein
VRLEDFKQVHMYPCVRESFLMGIGGGFGVGGARALWGGEFILSVFYLKHIPQLDLDWMFGLLIVVWIFSTYPQSCKLGSRNFRLRRVCEL